jgi:hypothetical protein
MLLDPAAYSRALPGRYKALTDTAWFVGISKAATPQVQISFVRYRNICKSSAVSVNGIVGATKRVST